MEEVTRHRPRASAHCRPLRLKQILVQAKGAVKLIVSITPIEKDDQRAYT